MEPTRAVTKYDPPTSQKDAQALIEALEAVWDAIKAALVPVFTTVQDWARGIIKAMNDAGYEYDPKCDRWTRR